MVRAGKRDLTFGGGGFLIVILGSIIGGSFEGSLSLMRNMAIVGKGLDVISYFGVTQRALSHLMEKGPHLLLGCHTP